MKIDLRSILHGAREFQFLVTPGWWEENCRDDSAIRLAAPMDVTILVSGAGNKYILDGRLTGDIVLRCDRCLESYEYHLVSGFRLALVAREGEDGQTEVELFREDLEEGLVDDLIIDLAEIAREQVFLALPMKSLCREDCAGLCPVCGTNLNKATCRCKPAVGHPGFSGLKALDDLPLQSSGMQEPTAEGEEKRTEMESPANCKKNTT